MAENRAALVTGASSGIGRGIAKRLGAKGVRVALVARRKDRLKEVAKAIDPKGDKTLVFPGDVRNPTFATSVVRGILDAWGRLDILVNNAGIGEYAPVEALSDESFREQFDANVYAPFLFMKAVVPQMKKQKSGQVANNGSVVDFLGVARGTAYVGTK